ncbi:aspartate dehydrogenase [Coprococcus sp. BIOML-A1]|nr:MULTISPECIES: aspartate dehydrogenase [unclassified Coprococcus]MZK38741.1 aspartate dehydrogenase [Coprococcus sp. BIOML-A1]MZK63766.1 aspartate dehydrogenase [Coprococcus sp. BIOML-A2]
MFPYDEAKHEAVIRCSICTGEQVAGFMSREDGNFVGVMVIQSEKDLENFKRLYRVDDVKKIY